MLSLSDRKNMEKLWKKVVNMKIKVTNEIFGANFEMSLIWKLLLPCTIRIFHCQYQAAEMSYQPCSPDRKSPRAGITLLVVGSPGDDLDVPVLTLYT